METIYRIMKHAELEWTHQDQRVQLLTLSRTAQESHHLQKGITGTDTKNKQGQFHGWYLAFFQILARQYDRHERFNGLHISKQKRVTE